MTQTKHADHGDERPIRRADNGQAQQHAAPGQPKDAPERIPGQSIPVEERKSPQKVADPQSGVGKQREHTSDIERPIGDGNYRATDSTGAGSRMAPGQQHPMSNAELPDDEDDDASR